MAEAFVRTLKRDCVRVNSIPNALAVLDQLPEWFNHYNEVHPHSALSYRSPASSSLAQPKVLSGLQGPKNISSIRYGPSDAARSYRAMVAPTPALPAITQGKDALTRCTSWQNIFRS